MCPRRALKIGILILGVLVYAPLLSGCQKMNQNGRVLPYEPNEFFPDGSSARMPVKEAVPRSRLIGDEAFVHGTRNGVMIQGIPVPVTMDLLKRGRERFEINCSPCHGEVGDGDGMIVRRGFTAPPTYHQDRLRNAPAGHFFDVITHGYGAMFSYADRVETSDRWAITAYIRALQKSQHAQLLELSPALRQALESSQRSGK